MNTDTNLRTPAPHTHYRDAPSRNRTVLFADFDQDPAADYPEHEESDIVPDKTVDIEYHGRSHHQSESPYNSSHSPSNSNDPSSSPTFDDIWTNDDELFFDSLMDTSGNGPVGAAHTLNAALHHIFNVDVIPVTRDLGPCLLDPKKNNRMAESISAAASHLSKTRPDIIAAITGITHATGTAAHAQILMASNLFRAHGKIHRVLTYALMIYL
jgi:hypothetical protein